MRKILHLAVALLGAALLPLSGVGCSGNDEARPFGGGSILGRQGDKDSGGLVRGGASQAGGSTLPAVTPVGSGSAGGGAESGGAPEDGGSAPTASGGGAVASGGSVGTGGAAATGGVSGSGGSAGTGGSLGTGGAATGGAVGAATTAECRQLIVDYDNQMQKARACMVGKPGNKSCATLVTEKLAGCGSSCVIYVTDAKPLDDVRMKWTKAACVDPVCAQPAVCVAPTGAVCNPLTAMCADLP